MTDPSLTSLPTLDEPGDAELISAVRAGDLEAYGTLFERHVDAARRLARQLVSAGDVDDLVSDAFSKVLAVLQKGGGPDLAFRAYLLTSLRRLHVDKIRATSRLTTTDDLTPYDPGVPFQDTAVAGFDNAAAAKAFAALPERWQQVLWHTEVEGQKPAEIAPLLGMSPNSVSALAYRAREGLRQAFVSMHAQEALDDACARTRANLGAYIRSGLSKRDSAKVDAHLQDCRECTAIYLELTEVNSNLGALLAPLLLGSAGAGYLAAAAAGTKVGFLLFLGGAKNWLLHDPVGRITAGATGVAAAAVVVAAVAMSGGGHNPPPVSAPEPSTPASAPSAANPPAANPPHKSTPKKSSPPVAPPAVNPPAAPPAAPPSSSTPPATPPQQAPVISTPLPAVDVTPGRSVVIDLTNGATDPNGDPLTVESAKVAKPSHGTVRKGGKKARPVMPRLSGGKTGLSGSAPILARSAGGPTTVTYTPKAGWRGTDTIHYTLTDGHGGEVSGSVKVTTPNADPVAADDTAQMSWPHQVLGPFAPLSIDVLANDTDANKNDNLRIEKGSLSQPNHGKVNTDGARVYYQRDPSFTGAATDAFNYTVVDGHGGSATARVKVGLGSKPNPPSDPTPPPSGDAGYSLPDSETKWPNQIDPPYQHVALKAFFVPDPAPGDTPFPSDAKVTLTFTLTGLTAPYDSGTPNSFCGGDIVDFGDGSTTLTCAMTPEQLESAPQVLHVDFTADDDWTVSASLSSSGFADSVELNNSTSASGGPIPQSDNATGGNGLQSSPGAGSARSGGSAGTGSLPQSRSQSSAPDSSNDSSRKPTTDSPPNEQPSLISKIVGALL